MSEQISKQVKILLPTGHKRQQKKIWMQFDSFPDLAQIFPGLGPHGEHDFSDLAIEISGMVGATITSTDFPAASVYVACQ